MRWFEGPPRTRCWCALAAVVVALAAGSRATAGPIGPGAALLDTSAASYSFSSSPIGANAFFAGSDPFSGTINLQGVPIASPLFGSKSAVFSILSAANPAAGSTATVPISLGSMTLESSTPVAISGFGGATASLYNVFVTLNPTASGNGGGMGTFGLDNHNNASLTSSSINAQLLIGFQPVTGGPGVLLSSSQTLQQKGPVGWTSASGFTGPLAYSSSTGGLSVTFGSGSTPAASTPEPTSLALASLSSLGLLAWGWKERKGARR
jgi:hypothetical protein